MINKTSSAKNRRLTSIPSSSFVPPSPIQEPILFFFGWMPLPPSINASYKIIEVPKKKRIDDAQSMYRSHRSSATARYKKQNEKEMVRTIGATAELETFKKEASLTLKCSDSYCDRDILAYLHQLKEKNKKVPLLVLIKFYFATPWLRDVDGGIKAATDAVFHYLGINDNMAVEVRAKKRVDRASPRCEIQVFLAREEDEEFAEWQ